MAFPQIIAVTGTNGTASDSTPTATISNLVKAGDLLLALIRSDAGTGFAWPGSPVWTELFDSTADAANDAISLAHRFADGSELDVTPTVTSGLKWAGLTWVIRGAHPTQAPEFATLVTGASATPNPGSLSPSWGAEDTLWIWAGGWEGEQTSPPASNPTNYASNIAGADSGVAGAVATNCRVATASRELNAASEDPGSWTISVSDDWTATVLAIRPAPDTHAGRRQMRARSQAVHRASSW